MSSEPQPGDMAWEQMLRQLLGPAADEAIAQLRASGIDPEKMLQSSGLPNDPALLQSMFRQVQQMMESGGDDPVNWSMARDLARQTAAAAGDPSLVSSQIAQFTQALSVADLWVDAVTDLPPAPGPRAVWNRAQWVEATLPAWRSLTEPVALSLTGALADLLSEHADESGAQLPAGMLRQVGSAMFGLQVGQAAGTLAREVFGTTDVGLPLLENGGPVLLATNVDEFADGLDTPVEEVRLFLAVREVAAARLFSGVPWLRGWLTSAVEAYARGIAIDPEQLEQAVRDIDPSDPAALQQALTAGVFKPRTTAAQDAALLRLETALALVEGWVDEVSAAATAPHLPAAVALREMLRRRRAAGGPAEHTFSALVGLELRPRRLRDAAQLWAAVTADGGISARDAVWRHPDLIPTSIDLDDPVAYMERTKMPEEISELDQVLADILGPDPDDDPTG